MIEMYAFAAIGLLIAGVAIGVLVMIRLGISRDDRPGGFPAHTNDRIARAARRAIGVGARGSELANGVGGRQDVLPV